MAILTLSDITTPRTPSELSDWYWQTYREICSDPEEVKKARAREGLYTHFVRDIYPLVIYAPWRFPADNVLCEPVITDQGFEALIYEEGERDRAQSVQVTWQEDGKAYVGVVEAMDTGGDDDWPGDLLEALHQELHPQFLKAAADKPILDCRSSTGSALLIVLDTSNSPLNNRDRLAEIEMMVEVMRTIEYQVGSVYLITTPHEGVFPVIEEMHADVDVDV